MFATVPLTGVAAQDPLAVLKLLGQQDAAVLRVGERLAVRGRALCGDLGWSAGMLVQRSDQYSADYRAAARSGLGIGDRPTIVALVPDGAAAASGLLAGDQITAVDGTTFDAVTPASKAGSYAGTTAYLDAIDAGLADGRARLDVLRDGRPLSFLVNANWACRTRFQVRPGNSANANANGIDVQVSSDLVADAVGDGELAAILAHELAHNILRHPQRRKARERGLDVRATEVEADRLSVYLLDAAGYGSEGAISFWRRWGPANDRGILSDRSTPVWRMRITSIEAEAAVIAAARAAGRAVVRPPDLSPQVDRNQR